MTRQTNHPGATEIANAILAQIYFMGGDIPQMLETGRTLLETAEASHDLIFLHLGSLYVAWAQSSISIDSLEPSIRWPEIRWTLSVK